MQLRFFTIPVLGGEAGAEELNAFLTGQRILSLDRQLVQAGTASVWAVCVAYEPAGEGRPQSMAAVGRRGKVDYREVLNEADFAVYAGLRTLRKEIADAEGVPAYALFTNEQLAEMVTRRVSSAAALREIPGIGEGRVDKYGAAFLQALAEALAQGPGSGGEAHEA
jgi:superfamily II DNA helicase RecQ